jgi:hypothetical protein
VYLKLELLSSCVGLVCFEWEVEVEHGWELLVLKRERERGTKMTGRAAHKERI